jgi:DUF438 domain-containing protein
VGVQILELRVLNLVNGYLHFNNINLLFIRLQLDAVYAKQNRDDVFFSELFDNELMPALNVTEVSG